MPTYVVTGRRQSGKTVMAIDLLRQTEADAGICMTTGGDVKYSWHTALERHVPPGFVYNTFDQAAVERLVTMANPKGRYFLAVDELPGNLPEHPSLTTIWSGAWSKVRREWKWDRLYVMQGSDNAPELYERLGPMPVSQEAFVDAYGRLEPYEALVVDRATGELSSHRAAYPVPTFVKGGNFPTAGPDGRGTSGTSL